MDDQPEVDAVVADAVASDAGLAELTAKQLRMGIVEIDDRVRALPADAFAEKYQLRCRADELRSALSAVAERDEAVLASWAERAGGKNAHVVDEQLESAKAKISSPIHSN